MDGQTSEPPEALDASPPHDGRIFARIAAVAGVAVGLGSALPWATATYHGGGVREYQRVTLGLSGSWTAPKLVAVSVALAVLIVLGAAVFGRSKKREQRIAAGVVVVAAGLTTWIIFGHLDLLSGVPADFRGGLPECRGWWIDCVSIASRPGLIVIGPAGLITSFFGLVALLRAGGEARGEGHRSDRWVLMVISITIGVATLLFVLWLIAQLSQMDTL